MRKSSGWMSYGPLRIDCMKRINAAKKYDALILDLHDVGCRNHCIFCGSVEYLNKEDADRIAEEELKKLDCLRRDKNIQFIIVSGRDAIEYYNFVGFLKKIKKITSISIFLQSHCIDFADIAYLKKVLKAGNIRYIRIPIYGHNACVHDSITQNKGSFAATIKAIQNLRKLHFSTIQLHTLFLKQNEKQFTKLFVFLLKFGYVIDASLPELVSFQGKYSQKRLRNVPDLKKIRAFFKKNIKIFGKDIERISLHDIPFCLAPGINNLSFRSDFSYEGYEHLKNKKMDKIHINKEIIPLYRVLAKGPECSRCILGNKCKGITKPYLDLGLFQPRPFLVSKS